ncbi:hypothetical protein F5X99DRAFT_385099 [Biscogniauxia marginata]|nr:hypothetical protein F5X99DRAFT_385099 [Biscogniauxia marginata]
MPEVIFSDKNLMRVCGSNDHVYAQIKIDNHLTRYMFLDKTTDDAAPDDMEIPLSCTDDPPKSDEGYLYAIYWGPYGKKDIVRCYGEKSLIRMGCPTSVEHFSISRGYLVIIDADGYIYSRVGDGSWSSNMDSKNHTNSRVANYMGTYYQSCSIDYWGSVYIYNGNDDWTKIDGNNYNRDLVAGPGWLMTRYPNGKTWKWHRDNDSWEALSGSEGDRVAQLVASSRSHVYRLFNDGKIQAHRGGQEWTWVFDGQSRTTYISVDDQYLYQVTADHKAYMHRHAW